MSYTLNQLQNWSNFTNETACFYVDEAIQSMFDMKNVTLHAVNNSTGFIFSSIVLVFGLFASFFGGRFFKPLASITAAIFGFCFVYELSEYSSGLSCDFRILISSISGLILLFATSCLIKLALFMIGAAAFGGFIHFVFAAFPELNTAYDVPIIQKKSLLYWGSLLLAGVLGGFMFKWKEKLSLDIMTSIIGGAAFSYGLHGLTENAGTTIDHWVFFGIAVGCSSLGFVIQRKLRRNKKKKQERRKESKESNVRV